MLRACEEIPLKRQFESVSKAKVSPKSGVLRINSQALRVRRRWVPAFARTRNGGWFETRPYVGDGSHWRDGGREDGFPDSETFG